jgi:tmRNA-binding protein
VTKKSVPTPAKKSDDKDKEKIRFKTVAENRRARHEYELIEVFEAGIVLAGTEVKSQSSRQFCARRRW